jgi:probable rRNA maturation factor
MSLLYLANRQKTRSVDKRRLRRIARGLVEDLLGHDSYELGVHLIGAAEMARLNETFLRHSGSTDVITFNHQEIADGGHLYGEIFISVDDAVLYARRLGVPWQSEVARYLTHGLLHLEGCDDLAPAPRRVMKRRENKLLKELSRRFDLGKLGRGKHGVQRE